MPILLPEGLTALLGQLGGALRTGFQRSHVIGRKFAEEKIGWLRRGIGFDVDSDFNLKPRPETKRDSATLGVAAHSGAHVGPIDTLKYDENDGELRKFANVVERKQRIELGDEVEQGASDTFRYI